MLRVRMKTWHVSLMLLVAIAMLRPATGSVGDRSPMYQGCVKGCSKANCSTSALEQSFRGEQPWPEKLLAWNCRDECRYVCMWRTVAAFADAGYGVPQFHGKWPFLRMAGVQEPASAFFSICNLLPHLIMQARYQKTVDRSAPMHRVWSLYGLVSVNTWFWSTIFHTRDFEFTERMDYFCAFSIVSYSLAAFFLRLLGTDWNFKAVASVVACASVFARHIYFMGFVKFDYGYNMTVNISVGAVNSVCWLAWSAWHWKSRPYVRKAALAVLLLNASVLLELLDFAPLLWTFDSHALWHATTAPVHFIWYSFLIDDALFLMAERKIREEKKTA